DGYHTAIGQGRLLRSPTVFEDAFKVLCTTNTTWRQTRAMVTRTVRALGAPLPDNCDRVAFPTPAAMLRAGEQFFKQEARLGYRAPAALALAEQADELEALRDVDIPTSELRRRLLTLKGIGPYGAATLLMLLGRYDYLAVDRGVLSFTAKKYFEGRTGTAAEIHTLYAGWGRWKYLAHWLDP
ncbi:MAG: DNA-3-methyladenine glycosylase family protein, partial [Chloroflexota bacterium]